jgi:gluconolactonase
MFEPAQFLRPLILVTGTLLTPISISAQDPIERLDPRFDALIPRGAVLEKLADGMQWAEGPVWDAQDGSLLFSDVPRNTVFRWKEGAGVTVFLEPSGYTGTQPFTGREPGSNGLTFDAEGTLLLCQHGDRRIARLERDGSFTTIVDRYEGKRFNSPNDLVFSANGHLYFTDPPYGLPKTFSDSSKELSFQGVYHRTPEGKLTAVITDINAPNGVALSPDGKTLYVANSEGSRPIWMSYPVQADGTLGAGRQFAEASAWVKDGNGLPDGLKVDLQGNVFATGPGGIHVFAPDGTRLGRIDTGVPTANLAWGDDGSVLYITANDMILRLKTTTRGRLR